MKVFCAFVFLLCCCNLAEARDPTDDMLDGVENTQSLKGLSPKARDQACGGILRERLSLVVKQRQLQNYDGAVVSQVWSAESPESVEVWTNSGSFNVKDGRQACDFKAANDRVNAFSKTKAGNKNTMLDSIIDNDSGTPEDCKKLWHAMGGAKALLGKHQFEENMEAALKARGRSGSGAGASSPISTETGTSGSGGANAK